LCSDRQHDLDAKSKNSSCASRPRRKDLSPCKELRRARGGRRPGPSQNENGAEGLRYEAGRDTADVLLLRGSSLRSRMETQHTRPSASHSRRQVHQPGPRGRSAVRRPHGPRSRCAGPGLRDRVGVEHAGDGFGLNTTRSPCTMARPYGLRARHHVTPRAATRLGAAVVPFVDEYEPVRGEGGNGTEPLPLIGVGAAFGRPYSATRARRLACPETGTEYSDRCRESPRRSHHAPLAEADEAAGLPEMRWSRISMPRSWRPR